MCTQGVGMASKTTTPLGLRLNNKDLAVIDTLVEMSGVESRTEMVRVLIKPTLSQLRTAMETKSIVKAASVRLQEEFEFNKIVSKVARASEIQTELPIGELQPA